MKKLILAVAVVVGAAWSTPAAAFGFDWGVTGGLNLTKLKLKGETKQLISSDNRAGWFVGAKANVSLALGFGLDGSLLYSQQKYNWQEKSDGSSDSHTDRSIAIPINLRYSIGLGSVAAVYLATGPQFDFALGNKDWYEGTFKRENMTTSWNVGAGVKLLSRLEVGVGYNFALGKVGESFLSNVAGENAVGTADNVRANTFTVSATVYF